MDENENVVKKKDNRLLSVALIMFAGILCIGFLAYHYGVIVGKSSVDLNASYHSGFKDGGAVGINQSIEALLYYAQNCSTATINYSNKIYGFVDVTCLRK